MANAPSDIPAPEKAAPGKRKRRRRRWLLRAAGLLLLGVAVLAPEGCALLTPLPKPTTVAQRIDAFSAAGSAVRGRVVVHWDKHMVPYIEAERDDDLAFTLGMVHAHLRLGQMEMFRRVAHGRLAEVLGPPVVKVDHSLRILNVPKVVDEIYRDLPAATKTWLEEFVRGVNFYQDQLEELPHEFRFGGIEPEPWTAKDILAIGRLGGADVNWLTWFVLLPIRHEPHYERMLQRFLDTGTSSLPSFGPDGEAVELSEMLQRTGRNGSNSIVVSGKRTTTGAALIANDPHVGITIPPMWLLVGMKSPSYHMVGMMFAGVPVMAIGRNEHIAWGGTNMRSASSDLFSLEDVDPATLRGREERIVLRFWFDKTVTIRESDLGPVMTDAPVFSDYQGPDAALRWMGHLPSDEITAMLRAGRATNWAEFRSAFDHYAIPGMNILYADVEGNIGQLLAVRLPKRRFERYQDLVLDPADPRQQWHGYAGPAELPVSYNPEQGFLVSANNVPVKSDPPVGFLFSSSDRLLRITQCLAELEQVAPDDLRRIHQDVYSITDVALRDALLKAYRANGMADGSDEGARALWRAIENWHGRYDADSPGAAAFQLLLYHFAERFYHEKYGQAQAGLVLQASYARDFLLTDLRSTEPKTLKACLVAGTNHAAEGFEEFPTWGEMHRLRIAHPFGNAPVIGGKYRFGEYPASGANDTVYKTAHRLTPGKHRTFYGSNARHVSDLSDPDENYFVLLGGQDGHLRSAASTDQVTPWLAGQYVRLPLRVETVRATFERHVVLEPTK